MSDITDLLDPIIDSFSRALTATVAGHSTEGYLAGSVQMVRWGRRNLPPFTLPFEGPPMDQAVRYATRHSAQAVKGIDKETRRRLAKVIGDGIKNKRGVPGLTADIRRTFTDMKASRAPAIARTETADALEESFMDRSKDMGVTGKRWVTVGDAEVDDRCAANEAEGVVPLDHVFSSGHTRPTVHPNCRCALAPVMLEAAA